MTQSFFEAVNEDFNALDRMVIANLNSRVPLVEEIAHYLIESGGKRRRPVLVLLAAKTLGYSGRDHIKLATVI